MFHTAEIRWFLEGRPEAGVLDWFEASPLKKDEDPRIDSYLLLPKCNTCGAKVRQGHFEIKAQTSPPEPVKFRNGIAGRRAAWVKWSSGLAGAQLLQEQRGPETWVQVEKSRLLRLFELSGGIEERPAAEWLPGPGCFIELATLRVTNGTGDWNVASNWWSFCLEAFGPAEDVQRHIDRMASSDWLLPVAAMLPAAASLSYPEWLARMTD
jgi:hypothetical protein